MQAQAQQTTKNQEIQDMTKEYAVDGYDRLVTNYDQLVRLVQQGRLVRGQALVTNSSDATSDNAARKCFQLCTLYDTDKNAFVHDGKCVSVEVEVTRFHGMLQVGRAADDLTGCNSIVVTCRDQQDGSSWRYEIQRNSIDLIAEILHIMVRIAHRLGMRPVGEAVGEANVPTVPIVATESHSLTDRN